MAKRLLPLFFIWLCFLIALSAQSKKFLKGKRMRSIWPSARTEIHSAEALNGQHSILSFCSSPGLILGTLLSQQAMPHYYPMPY